MRKLSVCVLTATVERKNELRLVFRIVQRNVLKFANYKMKITKNCLFTKILILLHHKVKLVYAENLMIFHFASVTFELSICKYFSHVSKNAIVGVTLSKVILFFLVLRLAIGLLLSRIYVHITWLSLYFSIVHLF